MVSQAAWRSVPPVSGRSTEALAVGRAERSVVACEPFLRKPGFRLVSRERMTMANVILQGMTFRLVSPAGLTPLDPGFSNVITRGLVTGPA
jgi:hypothetical protein